MEKDAQPHKPTQL